MRVGARSLRGAMGTYALVAAAALVVLALVLWLGPGWSEPRATVRLAPGGVLTGAVLSGAGGSHELRPGQERRLLPGPYELRLFHADGSTWRTRVELDAGAHALLPALLETAEREDAAPGSAESSAGG